MSETNFKNVYSFTNEAVQVHVHKNWNPLSTTLVHSTIIGQQLQYLKVTFKKSNRKLIIFMILLLKTFFILHVQLLHHHYPIPLKYLIYPSSPPQVHLGRPSGAVRHLFWMFTVKTKIKWSCPPSRTSRAGCSLERKSDFFHKMYRRPPQASWKSCTGRLYVCSDVELPSPVSGDMLSPVPEPHHHQHWATDGYTGCDNQSASAPADLI